MRVKLGEICDINMGQSPDSSTYNKEQVGLPFFQGNADFGEYSPNVRIWCGLPVKVALPDDILISVRAPIGALNIADTKCCIGRGLAALTVKKQKCERMYLWYALENKVDELNRKGTGSTFKAINKKILSETEFFLPPLAEQRKVIAVLDKVCDLIALRRKELERLDLMVKARFVDMFGDPLDDTTKQLAMPMTDLCDIIDGDRGKKYPKPDEFEKKGFCLFLNAKNVTAKGFCFDSCLFVTEKKDKELRKGKLLLGDIVLTTRGTIGNLALYDESVPYEQIRINSGMVILRLNKNMILERFFIEQFRMLLYSIKERITSGTAQPQLPISTMDKICLIVPDIREQQMFSAFVAEIDKLKSPIKQSLDTLETLKKSLMQEYFG